MKVVKFIYSTISTLVLIALISLVLLLVGTKLIGFTPYAVLSGSMEPMYHVGSVVYAKEVQADEIAVGDVITFYMTDHKTIVTHQVIEIDEANGQYHTQGLANDVADGAPVTIDRVIGKVHFGIPYLGYISDYVTSPPWIYIIVAAVLIWAIIIYMVDISKQEDKVEDKKKSKSGKK